MRVSESAMGKWAAQQDHEVFVQYIADCLVTGESHNVFWRIVKHHRLTARSPIELARKVAEHFQDFELVREAVSDE